MDNERKFVITMIHCVKKYKMLQLSGIIEQEYATIRYYREGVRNYPVLSRRSTQLSGIIEKEYATIRYYREGVHTIRYH